MPVEVQRQMVGETLLLVLNSRKSSTLFLEPLSESRSRGVYASVMEAFGRISQHFLCEVDTDAVLGHRFGVPVVLQRRSCSPFWCRGRLLARFALGNMVHYSFTILYLAVTCSVSGCSLRKTEHWILREMTWSLGAMLDSTVDTYSASVLGWLLEEFHDFLRDWADSVPEVDSRRISPCRHARYRQRQWLVFFWFCWS